MQLDYILMLKSIVVMHVVVQRHTLSCKYSKLGAQFLQKWPNLRAYSSKTMHHPLVLLEIFIEYSFHASLFKTQMFEKQIL